MPVMEAMASGLAVVATRCLGVATFAQHAQNCLLADTQVRCCRADAMHCGVCRVAGATLASWQGLLCLSPQHQLLKMWMCLWALQLPAMPYRT